MDIGQMYLLLSGGGGQINPGLQIGLSVGV